MHTIKFYPVGNGDCSQIILDNGKRVLMDFRQHSNATNTSKPEINLAEELREELKKADREYLDVVAFTHADKDHIQGSTDFFEFLYAEKYQGENRTIQDRHLIELILQFYKGFATDKNTQ